MLPLLYWRTATANVERLNIDCKYRVAEHGLQKVKLLGIDSTRRAPHRPAAAHLLGVPAAAAAAAADAATAAATLEPPLPFPHLHLPPLPPQHHDPLAVLAVPLPFAAAAACVA